ANPGVVPPPADTGAAAAPGAGDLGAYAAPGFDATPFPTSSAGPQVAATPGDSAAAAIGIAPRGSGAPSALAPVGSVAAKPSGWRASVGELLGVAAILAALVAWTEGYGLLGGRVRS